MDHNADGRTNGNEIEESPGVERIRGVSPRCAECDALAFDWIRNDDGGIDRREATGYRQASLAERIDAGQRYTVDSATVGEPEPEIELPNFGPLSGRQVAVWVAVELNGFEPRDFARQVEIAPSTARTHLQRARERIGGWSR